MTTGLAILAATYFLIAVQRLPFVHLNRPAALSYRRQPIRTLAMTMSSNQTLPTIGSVI